MPQKGIISTNQFVWMLFSIITSFTVLQVPGILIFHAGRDAWLSVIGAWFSDVMLAIIYAYMGLRFPGQNLVQYSITILGKYLGRIVGIMFPIFFLVVASSLLQSLGSLMNNLFLPKTPVAVILGISCLLIAYGVRKGIEAIARTCEVLGPIFFFSLLALLVVVLPNARVYRLKPILSQGLDPFTVGIPFILSFIAICIIMGMYIPICNKPRNGYLSKFIAASLGAIVLGSLVFVSISIFGAEQAGNMINPGIQLARLADIGGFIERMEIIWLIVALAGGIMALANLLWAVSVGLSQIAGLKTYKHIVYPVVLIAFILSLTSFRNIAELMNFMFYSYIFFAIFVQVGIEMFLFFMALILKKKG